MTGLGRVPSPLYAHYMPTVFQVTHATGVRLRAQRSHHCLRRPDKDHAAGNPGNQGSNIKMNVVVMPDVGVDYISVNRR